MRRYFAFAISVVVLVCCASCGDDGGGAIDPTAPVVVYTRDGGFSGYDDDIVIRGDFSYTHSYWGRKAEGKLSPEQTKTLKRILGKYEEAKWQRRDPPDTTFEDAIIESFHVKGTGSKTELADEASGALLSLMASLRDLSHRPDAERRHDVAPPEEAEAAPLPDPAMTPRQAGQIDKIGLEIEAAWDLLRSADAAGEHHGLRERILRTHIKLVRYLAELDQGAECWAEFVRLRDVPDRLIAGGGNWPQLPDRQATQQLWADGLRIDLVAQQCGKRFVGHRRADWAIRFATESNRARAAAANEQED